jgi:ribosomal protein S18 acetylase RimI-like enzyme
MNEESDFRIVAKARLGEAELEALTGLRAACESLDGIAALELEKSLNAHEDMPSFFLAYSGASLAGALSVFAPMRDEAELGALILPQLRRRGAFRALASAAEEVLADYGYLSELFVVDGRSAPGAAAAAALGAKLEFSEHACRYEGGGKGRAADAQGLRISRLGIESMEELVLLRMRAFGDSREDAESFERATFASSGREEYGAYLPGPAGGHDRLVAAVSLGFEGKAVSVNGLVVAEGERGKGYGQAFLGELLGMLSGRGLEIILDVNSRNETAFHVYRKLGFVVLRTMGYYRRPLPSLGA